MLQGKLEGDKMIISILVLFGALFIGEYLIDHIEEVKTSDGEDDINADKFLK